MYHWYEESRPAGTEEGGDGISPNVGCEDTWAARVLDGIRKRMPLIGDTQQGYPSSHVYGTMSIWPKCARALFEFGASDRIPWGMFRDLCSFIIYNIFTSGVLVAMTLSLWTIVTIFWCAMVKAEWIKVKNQAETARLARRQLSHTIVLPRHDHATGDHRHDHEFEFE